MYLLYCGLLVIWVLLLWPAFRLKGGARLWLLVVIAAGTAALIYEIRMFLWSSAAIRLDILLISIALVCLYGSAAALLFFNVGVETGQVIFIGIVLTIAYLLRGSTLRRQPLLPRLPQYGIGIVAAFWTIERVAAFWV